MSGQAGDVAQGRDQGAGVPGGAAADTARAAADPGPAAATRGSRPGGHQPWRAAFFALAAVAIVGGVGWALLDSRFFVVRSVTVTGTHLVTGAEVRSAAAIPPGLPLIRVNGATIAHRVEQIRQVAVRAGQPGLAGRGHDHRHRAHARPGRGERSADTS